MGYCTTPVFVAREARRGCIYVYMHCVINVTARTAAILGSSELKETLPGEDSVILGRGRAARLQHTLQQTDVQRLGCGNINGFNAPQSSRI